MAPSYVSSLHENREQEIIVTQKNNMVIIYKP